MDNNTYNKIFKEQNSIAVTFFEVSFAITFFSVLCVAIFYTQINYYTKCILYLRDPIVELFTKQLNLFSKIVTYLDKVGSVASTLSLLFFCFAKKFYTKKLLFFFIISLLCVCFSPYLWTFLAYNIHNAIFITIFFACFVIFFLLCFLLCAFVGIDDKKDFSKPKLIFCKILCALTFCASLVLLFYAFPFASAIYLLSVLILHSFKANNRKIVARRVKIKDNTEKTPNAKLSNAPTEPITTPTKRTSLLFNKQNLFILISFVICLACLFALAPLNQIKKEYYILFFGLTRLIFCGGIFSMLFVCYRV